MRSAWAACRLTSLHTNCWLDVLKAARRVRRPDPDHGAHNAGRGHGCRVAAGWRRLLRAGCAWAHACHAGMLGGYTGRMAAAAAHRRPWPGYRAVCVWQAVRALA